MPMRYPCDARRQAGQGSAEAVLLVVSIAIAALLVLEFFGQAVRDRAAGIAREIPGRSPRSAIDASKQTAASAPGDAAGVQAPGGGQGSGPAR